MFEDSFNLTRPTSSLFTLTPGYDIIQARKISQSKPREQCLYTFSKAQRKHSRIQPVRIPERSGTSQKTWENPVLQVISLFPTISNWTGYMQNLYADGLSVLCLEIKSRLIGGKSLSPCGN